MPSSSPISLRDLIEAIPVPIYVKDVHSNYVDCNRAFARYQGVPRRRIIGSPLQKVHPRKMAAYYRRMDERLLRKGGTQVYEFTNVTRRFARIDMALHKALVKGRDGRPVAIVGTGFDVTEHNDLERKQHDLLCSILPVPVVQQYASSGRRPAELKRRATIAFLDFVKFSTYAARRSPASVVGTLEGLFAEFDVIVKRHGLEKLKTIGDGYLFAGGLFTGNYQVRQTAQVAVEMLALLARRRKALRRATGYGWEARIGIHAGEVISGIIGQWRFLYDVWGNTVNVASRLEGASEPDRITVSRKVRDLLRNVPGYRFIPRGMVPVKNMDPIEMFFLQRVPQDRVHHG